MADLAVNRASEDTPAAISGRLVEARKNAESLGAFPGAQPTSLEAAYAAQEHGIGIWGDDIAGWKIGRLAPDQEKTFGQMRLSGPIFKRAVRFFGKDGAAKDGSVAFPVFAGGFAAVESEFVLRLGADAPANKTQWTIAETVSLIEAMHVGIETAGSPMAAINNLGATAVISDFGNNAGLILGPEIPNWTTRALDSLKCVTSINGVEVGRGTAANIPGGPVEALRFLLEHTAVRGRPLKKGMLISTGAITGIHDITVGQHAVSDFGSEGRILCHAVQATR